MNLKGKRILFIKQSSLGDVVHALPVAHAIKRVYPDSTIGWVVEKGYAGLLENDSCVDHVYSIHIPSTSSPGSGKFVYWNALVATLRTLSNLRRQLKSSHYDLVFDMHASFRSGLLALTNPVGKRLGFSDAKELNPLFQHYKIRNEFNKVHALEKNFLFCEHFNIKLDPCDLFLETSKADRSAVEKFLQQNKLANSGSFIYASPAARWESKFWPAEYWAQLSDRLIEMGQPVIFGGSPADAAYIETIADSMKCSPVIAAGKMELTHTTALIQKATAYIGLDSGPMHIAAMAKTPTIALFGPTHPEKVGPYGVKSKILQAGDIDCLCCRKRVCETLRCMKGISVDQVFDALCELLGLKSYV